MSARVNNPLTSGPPLASDIITLLCRSCHTYISDSGGDLRVEYCYIEYPIIEYFGGGSRRYSSWPRHFGTRLFFFPDESPDIFLFGFFFSHTAHSPDARSAHQMTICMTPITRNHKIILKIIGPRLSSTRPRQRRAHAAVVSC